MEKLIIHYGKFRDHETYCGLEDGSICIDPKAELAKEQVNCQYCIRSYKDRQAVKRPTPAYTYTHPITHNSLNNDLINVATVHRFRFPRQLGLVGHRAVISMEALIAAHNPVVYVRTLMNNMVRDMGNVEDRHRGESDLIVYEARFDEGGSILRSLLDRNQYEIRLIARPVSEVQEEEQETYDDLPF